MVNFINKKLIFKRIQSNLKREFFDGVGISLVLCLICIILASNIIRVINKGLGNYNVYLYEKEQLEIELNKNKLLTNDYEYYSSEETKKLLARDILNLGVEGEQLYTAESDTTFYQPEKKLLDLNDKTDFTDWWKSLIN